METAGETYRRKTTADVDGGNQRLPPLSLQVDFNDNAVTFEWDFKAVSAPSGCSTRHLLMVDFDGMRGGCESLLQQYYQWLPLGDFLKVVDLAGRIKSHWQERTNSEYSLEFTNQRSRAFNIFNHIPKEFAEQVCVVLLVGNCKLINDDFVKRMMKALNECHCHQSFSVLLSVECEHFHDQLFFLPANITLNHYTTDALPTMLKDIIRAQASIRARRADIYLQCFDSELSIPSCSRWQPDSHRLRFTSYSGSNSCTYREKLLLQVPGSRSLQFNVRFEVKLISGQQFSMQRTFCVKLEAPLRCVDNQEDQWHQSVWATFDRTDHRRSSRNVVGDSTRVRVSDYLLTDCGSDRCLLDLQ